MDNHVYSETSAVTKRNVGAACVGDEPARADQVLPTAFATDPRSKHQVHEPVDRKRIDFTSIL